MKILAIGDVHTKKWIIDLVESVIGNYDCVVFCGDYADDFGAPAIASIATWYRLQKLINDYPGKVLAVRGNHDHIYVEKTPASQSGFNQLTQLMINDPVHKGLKKWLMSLPDTLEVDGVIYAHAGLDKRWDRDKDAMWDNLSPIWVRPKWAQYESMPQVVGHTPQKTVTHIKPNVWLIDTFSTYSDRTPIGDGTMLEITNGKKFKKIKINANNNNTTNLEIDVPR